MLLPVDLRQSVPEDDPAHFVNNAVDTLRLPPLKINRRGSGSAQYPPRMMLGLLVYCYANGVEVYAAVNRDDSSPIPTR